MWLHVLALIALLGLVFLGLEILHAFYRGVIEAQHEDVLRDTEASKSEGDRKRLVWLLYQLLRSLVNVPIMAGVKVSLILHESLHAIVHAAMGGRPRIVLCPNGGYAPLEPWVGGIGWLPIALTRPALGGVACLAPVLGGSLLYLSLLLWLTPADFSHLTAASPPIVDACAPAKLGDLPGALLRGLRTLLDPARRAGVLGTVALLVAVILTAPSLTPSSTDFVLARRHLVGHSIAAVLAALAFEAIPRAAPWLLILVGAAGFVLYFLSRKIGRDWPDYPGIVGMTLLLLGILAKTGALGSLPARGIASGIAVVIEVLLFTGSILLAFLLLIVLLNLVGLQFDAIGLMLRKAPGELKDVFTRFHTCTKCNLHFHGKCDGCGRTPEELRAVGEGG